MVPVAHTKENAQTRFKALDSILTYSELEIEAPKSIHSEQIFKLYKKLAQERLIDLKHFYHVDIEEAELRMLKFDLQQLKE